LSGTLCLALKAISAGTVSAPNTGSQPFVQRENIAAYSAGEHDCRVQLRTRCSSFLAIYSTGCKKLGMKETDLFVTQDLFEGDNVRRSICLFRCNAFSLSVCLLCVSRCCFAVADGHSA
jgi:hypothetical protein